jgi:Cu(I)/Ag(I) efflux system membrane fusion protein
MTSPNKPYDPSEHEPMPEGEEGPPPYAHTMAIVRWIILGAMTLFALVMILNYLGVTVSGHADSGEQLYHCPMHPTYVSNQPGECPICGMTLVPINKEGKEIGKPEKTQETLDSAAIVQTPKAKPGQYSCPMDPQIISDIPARCSICGMKLVLVSETSPAVPVQGEMGGMGGMEGMKMGDTTRAKEPETMKDMGSAPVPGLVPITLEPERLQLLNIRTGIVQKHSLGAMLHLVGYVTPDETRLANIQVRFNGWVKKLFIDQTGQRVQAGDPLLSVYSQDLYQAEQDFIVARNATTRVATDQSLADMRKQLFEAARQRLHLLGVPAEELQRLDTARVAASELVIRSPFTGYVLEKSVVDGQYIGPDLSLFSIADLSDVWVLADVYEQDIAAVKTGQKASMTLTAFPGQSLDGTVAYVYPTVSEQTRTLKVRLQFSNPSMQIRPGMYADVTIEPSAGNEVLAISRDAVMDGGETQYAFVVHDGKHFEPRLLKLGRASDNYVEVLSGLKEGEQVVTSANFLIDSESRLKAAVSGMGGTTADEHAGHTH